MYMLVVCCSWCYYSVSYPVEFSTVKSSVCKVSIDTADV